MGKEAVSKPESTSRKKTVKKKPGRDAEAEKKKQAEKEKKNREREEKKAARVLAEAARKAEQRGPGGEEGF